MIHDSNFGTFQRQTLIWSSFMAFVYHTLQESYLSYLSRHIFCIFSVLILFFCIISALIFLFLQFFWVDCIPQADTSFSWYTTNEHCLFNFYSAIIALAIAALRSAVQNESALNASPHKTRNADIREGQVWRNINHITKLTEPPDRRQIQTYPLSDEELRDGKVYPWKNEGALYTENL